MGQPIYKRRSDEEDKPAVGVTYTKPTSTTGSVTPITNTTTTEEELDVTVTPTVATTNTPVVAPKEEDNLTETPAAVVTEEEEEETPTKELTLIEKRKAERAEFDRVNKNKLEIAQEAKDKREAVPTYDIDPKFIVYKDLDPDNKVKDDDLAVDPMWLSRAKIVWEMKEGRKHNPETDPELGQWALESMGWFNYHLPNMGIQAARLQRQKPEVRAAFLYLMEAYDDLGLSLSGTSRFLRYQAADPTNVVGITTLGFGMLAKKAIGQTTKAALIASIKAGLVKGAIENAVWSVPYSLSRQSVEGEGFSNTRTATDVAIGAGLGSVFGGIFRGGGTKISLVLQARKARKANIAEQLRVKKLRDAGKDVDILNEADAVINRLEGDVQPVIAKVIKTKSKKETGQSETNNTLKEVVKTIHRIDIGEPVATRKATKGVKTPSGKYKSVKVADKRNIPDLKAIVKPISDMLRKAKTKNPSDVYDYLLARGFTADQLRVLQATAHKAISDAKILQARLIKQAENHPDPVKALALKKQSDQMNSSVADLDNLDVALSQSTARALNQRVTGGINTNELRNVNPETLMLKGMTEDQALIHYADLVAKAELKSISNTRVKNLQHRVDKLLATGLPEGAMTIQILKKEMAKIKAIIVEKELSKLGKAYVKFNKVAKGAAEVAISNVFSTSTLLVNLLPSIGNWVSGPFMRAHTRGLSSPAIRAMLSEYLSQLQMTRGGLKMFAYAFRNESSPLTGSTFNRILDTNSKHSMPGMLGRAMRLFPKLLLGTDAYFEQAFYRGYVTGNATFNAANEGAIRGLKGNALKAYINKAKEKAIKTSYGNNSGVLDELVTIGTERGLSGEKLNVWVRKEMNKVGPQLRKATDKEGIDHTTDSLYKTSWENRKGITSTAASWYENALKSHPILRQFGQLFFRTPIRVVEAGLRYVPGVQFMVPGMVQDLIGQNGIRLQTRAHAQMSAGLAVTSAIISVWVMNAGKGAGSGDYKQRNMAHAAGENDDYTVGIKGGQTISYRNFEPIAVPMKLLFTALEKHSDYLYRKSQGDIIPQSQLDEVSSVAAVVAAAFAQTMRDANLVSAPVTMLKIADSLADAETDGDILKIIAEKVMVIVPNQIYKMKKLNEPFLPELVTWQQVIWNKWTPGDRRVSMKHSAIGVPQKDNNPTAKIFPFSPTTPADRREGVSDVEIEAEEYLLSVAFATNSSFTASYKHDLFPDVDLRVAMMPDGSMTQYDKLYEIMRSMPSLALSIAKLGRKNVPVGTPTSSIGKEKIQGILNTHRNAAAAILFKMLRGSIVKPMKTLKIQKRKEGTDLKVNKKHPSIFKNNSTTKKNNKKTLTQSLNIK